MTIRISLARRLALGLVQFGIFVINVQTERVLIAICAQTEGYAIAEDYMLASLPLNYNEVLSSSESIIVDILSEHGPVIQGPKLEELCLGKGIQRDS